MASETKTENVLLTGQSAYFKKNGSMTNYGRVTVADQEHTTTYGPGFIDEGSTVQPAILETSDDYRQTLADMRSYLAEDFIDETEDYLVKTNAENITTELASRNTAIQNIANHINKYEEISYIKTQDATDGLDMMIPITLSDHFVLEIKSTFVPRYGTAYNLISNGSTFILRQDTNGVFYINDIEIPNLEHSREMKTLEITQVDGEIFVHIDGEKAVEEVTGFTDSTSIVINTMFSNQLEHIKVYDEYGITNDLLPRWDLELKQTGLHDLQKNTWYAPTVEIALFQQQYQYMELWSGFLDTEYSVGPNTGIELDFRLYSSSTPTRWKCILGAMSNAGTNIAGTVSCALLYDNGPRYYATLNDNSASWVNSGCTPTTTRTVAKINLNGDRRFKLSGGSTCDVALTGSVTNTNSKNATLWLCAGRDLAHYEPNFYYQTESSNTIPFNCDVYIYRLKIYEGEQLVRHYVPVKSLTNENGMYDLVHHKFYKPFRGSVSMGGSAEPNE